MDQSQPTLIPTLSASTFVLQASETHCRHCDARCEEDAVANGSEVFCCVGCETVYGILSGTGMDQYYDLADNTPGVRPESFDKSRYAFLDDPAVIERLSSFCDDKRLRVVLRLPTIHCASCVWLLERIYRLHGGIVRSVVDYTQQSATFVVDREQLSLRQLVELLSSIGYAPELTFADLGSQTTTVAADRALLCRLAVAGFCFGNTMLFSFPAYLGLETGTDSMYGRLFPLLSLCLALPVVAYSARDYWAAAAAFWRRRVVTIDFPVFIGMAALFGKSVQEVLSQTGPGYFDSLCGLIFFLLIGRWVQTISHRRLNFQCDYRTFFPLWARVTTDGASTTKSIDTIAIGDTLMVGNGELVVADSVLKSGTAAIDYSFVTGESTPQQAGTGDTLYAGGRQVGGEITAEVTALPNNSYLTELWNQGDADSHPSPMRNLRDRIGERFTTAALLVALTAYSAWLFIDSSQALSVFVCILIVACPCALALSAPVIFGSAARLLSAAGYHLRDIHVCERLASIDAIVFDKTGTLTGGRSDVSKYSIHGAKLNGHELAALAAVVRESRHPLSAAISDWCAEKTDVSATASSFSEVPGCGIEGTVDGSNVWVGSRQWLTDRGCDIQGNGDVYVAINGQQRILFRFDSPLRAGVDTMMAALRDRLDMFLLTGDSRAVPQVVSDLFDQPERISTGQSPADKLDFVAGLENDGIAVAMVGDGLNDAGALKRSRVGLAVAEERNRFFPACDAMIEARHLQQLPEVMAFSRAALRLVTVCAAVSILYNIIGVGFAATGHLTPIIAAILMPLSSLTMTAVAAAGIGIIHRRHLQGAVEPQGGI